MNFTRFTWEKRSRFDVRRNRDNLNFKSVASASLNPAKSSGSNAGTFEPLIPHQLFQPPFLGMSD